MGTAEEGIDEILYGLELFIEAGILLPADAEALMKEANEFVATSVAQLELSEKINEGCSLTISDLDWDLKNF
jgi:hypothetical protein